jgi:hypothetical protein
MRFLCALCVLCVLQVSAFSLDREAFTFTHYDLTVRVEPQQQRLEVWGRITVRNDSATPQKNIALQISSSLSWHSITTGGKPAEFVSQTYASDIDHTGALSEAIVTMPQEVAPKATVDLDVRYEGIIALDTTRLTRIGVPEETARHTDWDQISQSFTAVRGVGYVAWYPVATEAASLADGNSVFETLGRWKARHADSRMDVVLQSTLPDSIFCTGTPSLGIVHADEQVAKLGVFDMLSFSSDVPTFVIAPYQKLKGPSSVNYLDGSQKAATAFADAITKLNSFGFPAARGSPGIDVLQIPDPAAAPFSTARLLLAPLGEVTPEVNLTLVYGLAKSEIHSPRAWIQEGLARYAQAAYVQQQNGRSAALNYLNVHRPALLDAEKAAGAAKDASSQSLLNATDEVYLQTKAQNVWWMLHDMVSEPALPSALLDYRAPDDKQPAYLQRLIEKQAHRDLEWFFDDWVYRDRGLPDFRVDSVFPRQTMQGNYIVTVTIENLGGAGAEVPVIVRSPDGESIKRLEVRAKSKNSIRFDLASFPQEVAVNDGSVPESDMSNNVFKVKAAPETQ